VRAALRHPALNKKRIADAASAVALLFLLGMASGCTTTVLHRTRPAISPEMLVAGAPLGGLQKTSSSPPPADVIRATEEMRTFAHDHVPAFGTEYEKLRALLFALRETGRFDLIYDDKTRTAVETFDQRRGNCLSFTNMFIALAREVGIGASFQEVAVPPTWVREGDSVIVNRHMNVSVQLDIIGEHVVDFNMADFRAVYPRRRVSDARGLAHFYSNIGVERMLAGDRVGALDAYATAIASDATFAPPWSNLGLLYLRAGFPAYAEAAWRHALERTPGDLSVLSNLAHLMDMQGRKSEREGLERDVQRYRMKNPYYRYWLAQRAVENGNLQEAVSQLKRAIRDQPQDENFYALLALVSARQSDSVAAQRWLAKAAEVATEDSHRRIYDHKLELLRAAATRG
jgi:Flp pilus assembly protein TadD